MGRSPRHDLTGACNHIMNRGADRQDIYSCNDDRSMFIHHLGELAERGLLEIHAFALMTNHFHLLGSSPDGGLSEAMHRLGSEYARYYNRKHRRDGPLFRNRFVSVPVESDDHFVVAARYIHRNPIALVPVRALGAYRWSSLGMYLGRQPSPEWLSTEQLHGLMGDADQHRRFVEESHESDDDVNRWRALHSGIDIASIEAAVAGVIGSNRAPRASTRRQRSDELQLALLIAMELRVETAEQLARRYGLASPSAVRTAARRARVRAADDASFDILHTKVMRTLLSWRAAA